MLFNRRSAFFLVIYTSLVVFVTILTISYHLERALRKNLDIPLAAVVPVTASSKENETPFPSSSPDEFVVPLERLLKGPLSANDPVLVDYVRRKFVVPPSRENYRMKITSEDPSMGQAAAVARILKKQKGGFFVECGALDGETRSNSYFFERTLGWEGLLIEADPSNFALLLGKKRKAFAVSACLSETPTQLMFRPNFNLGQIADKASSHDRSLIAVQCFPLWTIMLAINRTWIDYFSLDVEGAELRVLRAIPFDRLDIRVMSVEWKHVPEGKAALKKFVESQGYRVESEVTNSLGLANDFIFVKKK